MDVEERWGVQDLTLTTTGEKSGKVVVVGGGD